MLFRIVLVLVLLITVALVINDYMGNLVNNASKVVEITDRDIEIANNEVNEKGEIIISDNEFENGQRAIQTGKEGTFESHKNKDGSTTTIAIDSFGNKVETKEFADDSRLKRIIVRTSVKGDKRVFVYGQNGEVNSVPQNMLDSVLNISADLVANAAEIYQTKSDKERKKSERLKARNDRARKVQMAEFDRIRESLPDPVYTEDFPVNNENQREEKSDQISENQQQKNNNKREKIAENLQD